VEALPDNAALEVAAGAYDIWSAGDILASGAGAGVAVDGRGQIVNRGKIAGGSSGVSDNAAVGVVNNLYNYGSIDANGVAVSDTGGHVAVVHNTALRPEARAPMPSTPIRPRPRTSPTSGRSTAPSS
jgi:hypothetical protein